MISEKIEFFVFSVKKLESILDIIRYNYKRYYFEITKDDLKNKNI